MHQFLWGALAMGCWVTGLCFFRFWKITKDRLFLFVGSAFWVLVLNWTGLAFVPREGESRHYVYVLRLVAFVLIIAGIVDKNRRARATAQPGRREVFR